MYYSSYFENFKFVHQETTEINKNINNKIILRVFFLSHS